MRCVFASLVLLAAGRPSLAGEPTGTLQADEQALKAAGVKTDAASLLQFFRERTLSPAEPEELLLAYLPLAGDAVTEEVRNTLAAVAVRDGRPEPALVQALDDRSPARRAAAGVALARAGSADLRAAARPLLKDAEPLVRL